MNDFTLDLAPYADLLAAPAQWAMDIRHVGLLRDLIVVSQATSYLEVGVGYGVSTIAALEAAGRSCTLNEIVLCDFSFDPAIRSIVERSVCADRVRWFSGSSVECLEANQRIDFVFLDGDHSLDVARQELGALNKSEARFVALHDIGAAVRAARKGWPVEAFSGPEWMLSTLGSCVGAFTLSDMVDRPREATGRGLGFVSLDKEHEEALRRVFYGWTNEPFREEFDCRYVSAANNEFLPVRSGQT